jgi:hypothetical protein
MRRVAVGLLRGTLVVALLLGLGHARAEAQRTSRLAIGIGLGRAFPLEPIAQADGQPDYKLNDSSASTINIDYWWLRWFGTRVAYQWMRTNIGEPDVASFGRIYSVYAAALLAPVQLGLRRPPYLAIGGGVRRYNINSQLSNGPVVWDIAPRQDRPAVYGGVGMGFRVSSIGFAPEAGVFFNSFEHEYRCSGCRDTHEQMDLVLTMHLTFGR